ncbi:hypothetical protein [Gordonia alkanivorans]|uniref:deazapurine DNA modification protein DpdA family protein n=1 Tax=Gordonia alkanivorans TaxID=84096 RepID=UPI0004BAA11C|nr:hypothetical protein [Gordonia alkanivorans]
MTSHPILSGQFKPEYYLGSHIPSWLATSPVPLFISHRRLAGRRTLPRARTNWALDSGGFSELSLYGGWRTSPQEYIAAVKRYDIEIGNLSFAAPQDLMCEASMIARTGLSVVEHQRRTVANFVQLQRMWEDDPNPDREELPIHPVLQGYSADSYLQCWDMYGEAGIDLGQYPVVGLGSVCRRESTSEVGDILDAILDRDPDLPIHLYGVKLDVLRRYGSRISSCDTLAWSFTARRNPGIAGHTHRSCSNCREYAMRWRRKIVPTRCDTDHGPECDGTDICRFGGPSGTYGLDCRSA